MAQSRKQSESESESEEEKHRAQGTVTGLLSLAPFGRCLYAKTTKDEPDYLQLEID